MRTARPRPLSRMISATWCNALAASSRISALSKSNSTSAASSMRISVAVSLMFSASVLPAISTGLPPRSTTANRRSWTAKLRSVIRVTRSTIRMLRSGVRPVTSLGVCAWAFPQYVASASNAAATSDPRTRLIHSTGDRHVIHRDEMRHDDPDLLNRIRRRRELGPQIGAALGRNVFEIPAAQAVFVGILDDQVLFLVRGIDQIDAVDRAAFAVVRIPHRVVVQRRVGFVEDREAERRHPVGDFQVLHRQPDPGRLAIGRGDRSAAPAGPENASHNPASTAPIIFPRISPPLGIVAPSVGREFCDANEFGSRGKLSRGASVVDLKFPSSGWRARLGTSNPNHTAFQ